MPVTAGQDLEGLSQGCMVISVREFDLNPSLCLMLRAVFSYLLSMVRSQPNFAGAAPVIREWPVCTFNKDLSLTKINPGLLSMVNPS